MNTIRLATEKEIEALRGTSDIDIGSTVYAWDKIEDSPDFAVLRQCVEVDPVIFAPKTTNHRKALMIWGIEHLLKGVGVPFYYFNVDAKNVNWRTVIETWGAKEVSPQPEIRYKKRIA